MSELDLKADDCRGCKGTGKKDALGHDTCLFCSGSGYQTSNTDAVVCPHCGVIYEDFEIKELVGFRGEGKFETTCSKCKKNFRGQRLLVPMYHTRFMKEGHGT